MHLDWTRQSSLTGQSQSYIISINFGTLKVDIYIRRYNFSLTIQPSFHLIFLLKYFSIMNVNIFCPSFFCCLEHDNSKSPSDFIVIHGIEVNMTFPGQPRARRRSAQTVRPRPSGCAQPRVVKPTKCPFLRKIAVMVISTLVETGPGWLRVELKCSNSRGMSQTAAAQPQPARHVLLPPPTVFGKLEISDT